MYSTDKPIVGKNEDILERKHFSRRLAEAILAISSQDNINIGLYGEWGTGKTSIINMTIEEIMDKESKSSEKETFPIIIKFQPWNITDDSNLIVQFFKFLQEQLNIKDKKTAKKIGNILNQYSSVIEVAEYVPVVGKYAKFTGKISSLVSKKLISKNDESISTVKNNLEKELRKLTRKIIIVIDDIDRLSNRQIRMIFQLVSSIAGLPNLIYLLSMDKKVVVRALEGVQQYDGLSYLEKIIQVPFDIPSLNHKKVLDIFIEKLNEQIANKEDEIYLDSIRWSALYNLCIKNYIRNIRDVNRVLNIFNFNYNALYSEVDFVDMVSITVIQVMKPNVYKWILENKEILCTNDFEYTRFSLSEKQKKMNETYTTNLSKIDNQPAIVLEILNELFPVFSKKNGGYNHFDHDHNLLRRGNVGHEDNFDLYFELNVEERPFKLQEVSSIINTYNKQEMFEIFTKVNRENSIINLIDTLRSYADEMSLDRVKIIVQFLYDNVYWFVGSRAKSFIDFSAQQYTEWLISDLLKNVAQEEVYNILKLTIIEGNLYTLRSLVRDLHSIEISHGRLTEKEPNLEKQLISLEHLLQIETEFSVRIKEIIGKNESKLFELDNLGHLLFFWNKIDTKSCSETVARLISIDHNIPQFIVRMGSKWTGTTGEGWSYEENNYDIWIKDENILSVVNDLIEDKSIFQVLNEDELIKLSFYKLSREENYDRATQKEAIKLVKKWREP